MSELKKFLLPDIGMDEVEITEVYCSVGDSIECEQDILSVEGDKASMDVPSSVKGVVKEVNVVMGDKISEGDLIFMYTPVADANVTSKKVIDVKAVKVSVARSVKKITAVAPATQKSVEKITAVAPATQEICVPDIGGDEVEVTDIMLAVGDFFEAEQDMLGVEGDKASMEIPAPFAGTVVEVKVAVGDKVSEGTVLFIATSVAATAPISKSAPDVAVTNKPAPEVAVPNAPAAKVPVSNTPVVADHTSDRSQSNGGAIYASPSVRRLSREFGVDLRQVEGTGRKNRIVKEDVKAFVKYELSRAKGNGANIGGGTGMDVMPYPEIDYAKFGEIEIKPLSRIQKISGPTLHRNWVTIPHVTQFDEADITDLEAFRKDQNAIAVKQDLGLKISPLVFMMKAVAKALQDFPNFNASLSSDGESIIFKKYINVGIAVDTPNGLVVPVIKNVISRGIYDLSRELGEISKKARAGKLTQRDMQGGSMTISSLGGIGGTQFSPIVNAPEVAILGVSKSAIKPVWDGKQFSPRLMVPLALSYDHRVVDGADGARFITAINHYLSDLRTLIL